MEVRKGFKQTDAGIFPSDWDVVDYISFGQVIDGDRGTNYPGADDFQESGYCLFLNAGNVTKTGFRFDECMFITEEKDKKLNKGKLTRGDCVLTTRGTVGNFAYFNKDVQFDNLRINSGMVILRNTSPNVLNTYQYLVFCSNIVSSQLERLSFGSAQPQLTVKGINTLKIPIPPTFAEQDAIAEALSDADALIESLETLLTKKRQVKQGAMSELLTGKRRLSGFSGKWKRKNIKSIVQTPVTDGPHLTPVFLENGIPFLSVNNIVDNFIDWSNLRYISLEDHQVFSKKCKPQRNDILLGKAASVGKLAIVETDIEFNIWSPIAMIRVAKENNPKYIYFALQTRDISKQIEILTNSSSQGNIGMGEIEKIEVALPLEEEQTAIAEILSDMDAEIATLEEKLVKARQVKQGMMSELLTGKIRLV